MSALSSTTSTRGRGPPARSAAAPGPAVGPRYWSSRPGSRRRPAGRPAGRRRRDDVVGGEVRAAEGDPHRERAALAGSLVTSTVAAVQLRDLRDQREPDARALVGARLGAADPVEPLEQVGPGPRGIPVPVSVTDSTAPPSSACSATVTPPAKVNFNAFESRLSTSLPHRSRSTYTGSDRSRAVDGQREVEALRARSRTCWPARGCSGRGRPVRTTPRRDRSRAARSRAGC